MSTSPLAPLTDPEGFGVLGEKYFQALAVQNISPRTIEGKLSSLKGFVAWCGVRDIHRPADLTKAIAEAYQRHLHHLRKDDNAPLSVATQRKLMTDVKVFCRWLVKVGYLPYSPVETLEMPKVPKKLPRAVLSAEEVEKVLAQADTDSVRGLRDRAIMEVLYSTGIRRGELVNLQIQDLDRGRGLLRIHQGKGNKDRVVPIGDRALGWVARYLDEARPELMKNLSEASLFISCYVGKRMSGGALTSCLREYIEQAGIDKPGSVHIFRHSTATLMLENGADIRHIQSLLGHADLSTTQLYTQVAITHLKDVHEKTHPANRKKPK